MRHLPSRIALLGALALAPACDGCRSQPSAAGAPSYISLQDDVVVVGDVSWAADGYQAWKRVWDTILTEAQLAQAEQELGLVLGFNPVDLDAVGDAGLRPSGQWAAGWAAERDHWVIALPASDPAKLKDTVIDYARRRLGTEPREAEGVTSLISTFGPEEVERGAVSVRGDVVLWVLGRDATRVSSSVALLSQEASAASLGGAADEKVGLRGRVDVDGPALAAWARRSRVRDGERIAGVIAAWATRFDFALSLTPEGLDLDGRLALTEDGRGALKQATPEGGASLAAVRSVAVPDAIVSVVGALNPQFLFETLLPADSEARRAIDEARARGQLVIDLEKEVVPALSGSFALALGAGDLSELSFRELVGAPERNLWSAFAIGRAPDVEASPYDFLMKSAEETEAIQLDRRNVADVEIIALRTSGTLATELAQTPKAWFGTNEPAIMNRILAQEASESTAPSLLEADVRFAELARALKSFRAASLPLFVRATWAQILDAVDLLGAAELEISEDEGGLQVDFGLRLREPAESEPAGS